VRIARAGWPFIVPIVAIAALFALTRAWPVAIPLAILAGYVCFFFRDPDRVPPSGERLLLAPGDGRIMRILSREDGCHEVHIFLGLLDVHVNRAPADAVVRRVEAIGNAHLLAWKDEAVVRNVQNHIVFDTPSGPIEMRQIVGFAARRLEFWKAPGDAVRAGDRIGIMKFGSRIDLLLPPGTEIDARPGDRVLAGLSVLGRLPPGSALATEK
jgi:phosphatidylserine decarboxylase